MERNDVFKCEVCGLTAEVTTGCNCGETPICCGKPMMAMPEQTAEFKFEKHVPYPETTPDGKTRVTVGKETSHPMLEAHHIEWIEIQDGDSVFRRYLRPGADPVAVFDVQLRKGMIIREFCNLHGLWKYVVE